MIQGPELLIFLFVLLIFIGPVVLVIYLLKRNKKPRPAPLPQDPFAEQTPDNNPKLLRVGDVVSYNNHDWVVRGSIFFDQDGYRWQEHLIDCATDKAWLCVEDDEGLSLSLYRRIAAPALDPTQQVVVHDSVSYRRQESGEATFTAQGNTGTGQHGDVSYHDFKGTNGELLGFEKFANTSWEVSAGTQLALHEVDVLRRAEPTT